MSDSQLEALRADFERDLATATSVAALRGVRDRYLSRKGGLVSGLLKSLGSAPPDIRPRLGKLANIEQRIGVLPVGGTKQLQVPIIRREQIACTNRGRGERDDGKD